MKRTFLLLIVVLALTAGNVYAHDAGDLMLGIEPQIGIALPSVSLMSDYSMFPGIDFSLRMAFDYYLTDFLALGTGIGYSGNFHFFVNDVNTEMIALFMVPVIGWLIAGIAADSGASPVDINGYYFASYVTVPFGIRFSGRVFTLGAGGTANFPVYGSNDVYEFKLLPYLGWYGDIGFDLSGRKGRKNGFGMLFRLNGSITKTAEPVTPPSEYFVNCGFFSTSLILKANIELANLPIGGKKQ